MLARTTISTLAAGAAALALTGWTGGIGSPRASRSADNSPGAIAVDAELVIAVDVSNSMDPEEQALQREGYITGANSSVPCARVSTVGLPSPILSGPVRSTRRSSCRGD
jgi:hypothetical protein